MKRRIEDGKQKSEYSSYEYNVIWYEVHKENIMGAATNDICDIFSKIYSLWGLPRLLLPVSCICTTLLFPLGSFQWSKGIENKVKQKYELLVLRCDGQDASLTS